MTASKTPKDSEINAIDDRWLNCSDAYNSICHQLNNDSPARFLTEGIIMEELKELLDLYNLEKNSSKDREFISAKIVKILNDSLPTLKELVPNVC